MRRLRAGEIISGLAGLVLLASLWSGPPVLAVLLCLAALPALALPVAQAGARSPAPSVALGVLTTVAGIVAVPLAVVRLLERPSVGAWLGVVGAAGVLVGGWLSMRAERVPGAVPPHVPRRPAPPPSA
jgi:hypothetical protein